MINGQISEEVQRLINTTKASSFKQQPSTSSNKIEMDDIHILPTLDDLPIGLDIIEGLNELETSMKSK